MGPYSAIFGLKWCVFSLEIISLKPYVVKKSKNSTTYFSYHVYPPFLDIMVSTNFDF